jgi:hypothetical protein
MYNIGIRISHGTFQGVNLVTNHNFVSLTHFNPGDIVPLNALGVVGEVYQVTNRYREITGADIFLNVTD